MKICDTYCKRGKILLQKKMNLIKEGMSPEDASKCLYAFCPNLVSYYYAINIVKIPDSQVFVYDKTTGSYIEWLKEMSKRLGLFGKMDVVIQNPPYDGGLHLLFLKQGLDMLNSTGKMTIIEPSKWLIDVRKYGKRGEFGRVNSSEIKKYDEIKNKLEGHVKSITIENLNRNFGTTRFEPYSITNIDLENTYEYIDFTCCGEHKMVKTLYDCNMVGDYNLIWSIFNKVHSFKDMMKDHITNKDMGDGYWYVKYAEIIGHTIGCSIVTNRVGFTYNSQVLWNTLKNGTFIKGYTDSAYHYYMNDIQDHPHCAYDRGKHLTDKVTDNIYGTKQELENWKYFIFNNKLPLFLNIVLTIDQNNVSHQFIPWLVDKQYTDDEINELFGFTENEIKLIDDTLKKFEYNSPWFKRYMCGVENKEIK